MLVSCSAASPAGSRASAPEPHPAIDPAALQILERSTNWIDNLRQFSVKTEVTIQDVLETGFIADLDVTTQVTVRRPNRIRASRRGDVIAQEFYYDGVNLTLYNPDDRVYATVIAPKTIEGTIHYTIDTLGLTVPAADLIYQNSYPLLLKHVSHAELVGKAAIGGVRCDHLLFVRPDVEFQLWVADSGAPRPMKYVVTDVGTPDRLSITTVMSGWNDHPEAMDAQFVFRPPAGAMKIDFLPLTTTGGSGR